MSSRNKFFLNLLFELILSPYLYTKNFIKWSIQKPELSVEKSRTRVPVDEDKLSVCIHEWGGYKGKRSKKIKNIAGFDCGLDYQLLRFQNYNGKYDVDLTVTISDSHLFERKIEDVKIINVPNVGMDFSGYETFFENIKNAKNKYVLLTNTSVNKKQVEFIDDYLDFFKANRSVGMMGVSFNSKMYQSLIRNNFNPHLQSFFLLTTTEVLKELVEKNKSFPGKGVDFKLALIREGEIKLSRIVMDLGYELVCVLKDGTPYFFNKSCFRDNGRNSWRNFFGDYRLYLEEPNSIHQLNIKKA
ncbi:hypothetical protein [Flavobacterium sp. HBTb2-11-1]|uniref:hypothetical protein n=1 Tax=Flavobacterium sp. HBTb2-11-1 TaxID=2692212 RepID=UPI00136F1AC1|nr:hypothetical protein [Flavobacterium sp. HBTb2-11-1]MXO06003.1 hypothetical protein [Flavobacterium sp. HBTb2-11-1]